MADISTQSQVQSLLQTNDSAVVSKCPGSDWTGINNLNMDETSHWETGSGVFCCCSRQMIERRALHMTTGVQAFAAPRLIFPNYSEPQARGLQNGPSCRSWGLRVAAKHRRHPSARFLWLTADMKTCPGGTERTAQRPHLVKTTRRLWRDLIPFKS